MQKAIKDLVDESLQKARRLKADNNNGQAYAHYTAVIELAPDKRADVEEEFTDVLCKWGMEIGRVDFKKAILCYTRSLEIFPESARMLNNYAAHYLRRNCPREALEYLKQALIVNPDFLPAEWNLDYAYNLLVNRWHFPMLNDTLRNKCFANAICDQIKKGRNTVLDIGTGTGLLALYARDLGAKRVYACEACTEMSFIANKVLTKNKIKDIKLLPMHSTRITIPKNIPKKVKLIVTETFDAGLFGELVLSTLIDAHENLLAKDGMIIPKTAKVFAAAIQSPHIRFFSFAKPEDMKSDICLNFKKIDIYTDNKYYDAASLKKLETIYITDSIDILNVDFNNLSQMKALLRFGTYRDMRTVECKVDGIIDGLIVWFKLEVDEKNIIDTSDENSCWQFAVFAGKPLPCKSNEKLTIVTRIEEEKLCCSCYLEGKTYDWSNAARYFSIPQRVVMFLNDNDFISSAARVAQAHANKSVRFMFDACPFPIYGLEMLKHNSHILELYCYAETEELCNLIMFVAKQSGINTDKIITIDSIEEINRKLDVIFNHNFTIQGEINDWSEPSMYEALRLILSNNGFMLPHKISLIGQLVYSDEIPKMIFVDDKNLYNQNSNYIIGEFVNQYSSKQRYDLDSTLYKTIVLSDAKVLIDIDQGQTTSSIVSFGKFVTTNTHLPNAMICWYRIYLNNENYVDSKRDNSFMNHSAMIFDNLKEVIAKGKEVAFNIIQMKGLTRLTLVQ